MNRFRDMAIQNYTTRLTAAILDLVQPEVETFDPPTLKLYDHKTKREVNRMTCCRNMAIRKFLTPIVNSNFLRVVVDSQLNACVFIACFSAILIKAKTCFFMFFYSQVNVCF